PVVERHLFPLQDLGTAEHTGATDLLIEGTALMRVLAVAEIGDLRQRETRERRQTAVVRVPLREPPRDRHVVRGRMGEGLGGARGSAGAGEATRSRDLVEDRSVAVRTHHDPDRLEALRPGTD